MSHKAVVTSDSTRVCKNLQIRQCQFTSALLRISLFTFLTSTSTPMLAPQPDFVCLNATVRLPRVVGRGCSTWDHNERVSQRFVPFFSVKASCLTFHVRYPLLFGRSVSDFWREADRRVAHFLICTTEQFSCTGGTSPFPIESVISETFGKSQAQWDGRHRSSPIFVVFLLVLICSTVVVMPPLLGYTRGLRIFPWIGLFTVLPKFLASQEFGDQEST